MHYYTVHQIVKKPQEVFEYTLAKALGLCWTKLGSTTQILDTFSIQIFILIIQQSPIESIIFTLWILLT